MSRTRVTLLSVLVVLLVTASPCLAQEKSPQPSTVTIGLADDFAPYMFRGPDGEAAGLMVETAQSVAEAVGMHPEFHLMPWVKAKEAFRNGELQVLAGFAYSHQRDTWANFSHPILTQSYGIFYRKEARRIRNLKDLKGKSVLLPGGTAAEDLLREQGLDQELVPVSDTLDAFLSLATGRFDYAISPWTLGELVLTQERMNTISMVSPPVLQVDRCFAVREKDSALLDSFNEGLQHLRTTGRMREIQAKWLGVQETPNRHLHQLLGYLAILSALSLLLLLFVIAWSTTLRRQVKKQTEELQRELSEKIQAEEESQRARWFLGSVIDSLNSHIAILDAGGVILQVNAAWRKFAELHTICGLDFAIGKNYLKVCDEAQGECAEDTSKIATAIRSIQSGANPDIFMEYPRQTPTGKIWFSLRVTRFEAENSFFIVLAHTNITDRIRAQEDLRDSEKKYRSLVENIPGVAWTANQMGELLFVSPVVEQVLGFTHQEALDLPEKEWIDRIFPDDVERYKAARIDLYESNIPIDVEYRFKAKDGRWIWIHNHSGKPYLNNGIKCIDGVLTDITAHKQADEQIRFQADLLEHIGDHITATDLDGYITYVNGAECRLLGKRREDLIGKHVNSFGQDPSRGATQQAIITVTQEKGEWSGEVVNYDKDGHELILECRTWMVRDERGTPVGLCGVSSDISERKRAEAERLQLISQLNQAQKLESLGVLAGGIAHDFNNILSAVLGYSHLVLSDLPETAPIRANVLEIQKAGLRAKDLVDQILTFSRRAEEDQHPLELHLIVKESLRLLRASIPTTIQIRQMIANNAGFVLANASQMHQIMMNLCTNAAHAMEGSNGVLEVGLDAVSLEDPLSLQDAVLAPGSYIRLSIRDTGQGIPPEIIGRIFDPFFTTKEPGKGTGLGLSVVHGIVRSHGGAVTVWSEPGKGSLFEVYLPKVEAQPAQEPSPPVHHTSKGARILFVDDEDSLVRMGEILLTREGYHVVGETSPLAALQRFHASSNSFDLIITDYTMPGMTGVAMLREIRKTHPHLPIVLTTGYTDPVTANDEAELRIHKILRKPVLTDQLIEVIEEALHKGRIPVQT